MIYIELYLLMIKKLQFSPLYSVFKCFLYHYFSWKTNMKNSKWQWKIKDELIPSLSYHLTSFENLLENSILLHAIFDTILANPAQRLEKWKWREINIQFCPLYGVQGVGCFFVLIMDYSQITLNTCTPWRNRNVTELKQSKQVYTKKQSKKTFKF